MVRSCSPGVASGATPRSWPRYVRSQPGCRRADQLRAGGHVVDHHQPAAAHCDCARPQPFDERNRHRDARAVGRVRDHQVGLGRQLAGRGHDALDQGVAVGGHAHLPPHAVAPLDDPEREVVEQLVGEQQAVEPHRGEVVERGDDRTHARHRHRCVLVVAHHRPERVLERLDVEQFLLRGAQSRASARPARSAARSRTRARWRARRARAGRGRRRPRSRGTDRAQLRRATIRRARAATSAPKSGPTSGLVTKSRPARPAPRARVKNPPSP